MLKGILKDTLVYSAASFIAKGVGFFLIPLYTRLLSPADYGTLDLLNVFMAFAVVVISGELFQGVARFLPEMKTEEEKALCASTTLLVVFSSFVVFVGVSLAFSGTISGLLLKNRGSADIIRLALPWIALSALLETCQSQLRYDLKSRQYSVASVLVVSVSLASTVLFVLVFKLGVRGFILGQMLGSFAGVLASFSFARNRYRFAISGKLLKQMLTFSLPLIPSSLTVLLWSYIDRFFIRNYLSIGEVGIYGIGVRFASLASILLMGMNMALTPIIYASYKKEETPENLSRIFSLFVLAVTPLLMGALFFSREVLVVMTTEKYYAAAAVIPFLMTGAILSQLYNFAPGIFIAKKTYLIIVVNAVACLFSVGANLLLIPRIGILGAGIVNAANGLVVFSIYILFGQRVYKIPYRGGDIVIACASVAVSFLVCRFALDGMQVFSWRSLALKGALFAALCVFPFVRIVKYARVWRAAGAGQSR